MQLKEYLKTASRSHKSFSEELGIHYQHLNNILRQIRKPSPPLALRISEATGGKVTVMELLFPKEKGEPSSIRKDEAT